MYLLGLFFLNVRNRGKKLTRKSEREQIPVRVTVHTQKKKVGGTLRYYFSPTVKLL